MRAGGFPAKGSTEGATSGKNVETGPACRQARIALLRRKGMKKSKVVRGWCGGMACGPLEHATCTPLFIFSMELREVVHFSLAKQEKKCWQRLSMEYGLSCEAHWRQRNGRTLCTLLPASAHLCHLTKQQRGEGGVLWQAGRASAAQGGGLRRSGAVPVRSVWQRREAGA